MATFDSSGARTNYGPDTLEIVGLFLSLICISLMSLLFGRKTSATKFTSLNFARGLVVGLYTVSWLFSLIAAILAQTNNFNPVSCTISNFVCILLYAGSKVIIYLFLIERVYVVTAIGVTRQNSPMFKFNIALLSPYIAIVTVAIIYRTSLIDTDGQCRFGILDQASIPLIAYDCFLNVWLTALFLRALVSSTSQLQGPTKSKLRMVAYRTFVGSILSFVFSTANIASIVVFNGHERGVICLGLCTLDVTLNAITIHWVTSRARNSKGEESDTTRRSSRVAPQYGMTPVGPAKHVSALETHVSVSIESYVEEYHQLHIANKSFH
ncbi:hypothetical protein BGX21_001140 [Mortierella sp. AD011]|nr:hypothetical protein BGX20_010100 [Mortierella sp. AD010]KAF9385110.1 hypothetical protein BGX21_001140 [Mortierella sp. AD011]